MPRRGRTRRRSGLWPLGPWRRYDTSQVVVMRVLVIEPEGAVRGRLEEALRKLGHVPVACRLEAELCPELALHIDVVLAVGVAQVSRVGALLALSPPPRPWLLALLDPAAMGEPMAALGAGADDYFLLPLDADRFGARLLVAERNAAGRRAEYATASQLRSFFDGAPMMMGIGELVEGDDPMRVVSCNRATAQWLGHDTVATVEGRTGRDLGVPPEGVARWVRLARESSLRGGPAREEFASQRGNHWLALTIHALPPDEGRQYFSFVVEDITTRMLLQQQLLLADRLVSIGTLAAGVAHEINNPLMYVMTNLDLVSRQLDGTAPGSALDESQRARLLRALSQAREGSERVRQIVRDLRTFSRGDDDRRGPVHVTQVVNSAIDIAHNELRHRARLRREYETVPPVEANEARLGQVFVNLLVNAAQSIGEDSPAEANEVSVTVRWDAARERVAVSVQDTGRGIAREQLARVFDPFFTTKSVGEGTGLGLSICHGIVKGLGGDIEVESTMGVGTTFRVLLPAATSAPAPRRVTTPPMGVSRRVRVLVVDDEANLRSSLAQILAIEHEVEDFGSARAVVARVREGARWDVILCDLMMPDMNGMELFAVLEREAPEMARRTVFLTGGAFTPRAQEFLARVPNPRLEKPFEIDALRALIQRVAR